MNDNNNAKTLEEIKNTPLKARTVKEEYQLSKHEQRQPNCIYCEKLLTVVQEGYDDIKWNWDDDKRGYIRGDDNGTLDEPFCQECKTADWDFVDDDLVAT
ncbi:MAG: hypothetical protein LiPW30_764 [Parcubacteria group bacterium LiPW_30]|nr:MAG: hypothetical protein LiPW30_764 [Parcubacteria group bacterium LiPW_30]